MQRGGGVAPSALGDGHRDLGGSIANSEDQDTRICGVSFKKAVGLSQRKREKKFLHGGSRKQSWNERVKVTGVGTQTVALLKEVALLPTPFPEEGAETPQC